MMIAKVTSTIVITMTIMGHDQAEDHRDGDDERR